MRRYSPKWWPEYSGITGRDQMESVAGMKWNGWPEWNGIHGRDRLEYAIWCGAESSISTHRLL